MLHRETSRETVVSCIFVLFICIKRLDIVYICVALCAISSLSENLTVPVVMGILKIGLFYLILRIIDSDNLSQHH